MKERPLCIVLTPVRNEAWVLRAFLEATSLWADIIIIADQMSTDGSREIAKEYPKVVLVDNKQKEMQMASARRLLFEEAKKIEGDKILFALDADEFLFGNFVDSDDWKAIMQSKPNDVFCWRWMNLKGENSSKCYYGPHYYWSVHVADDLWDGLFPDNFIHEWRLPWPKEARDSNKHLLNDLFSVHLAWANQNRQRNKERFYQVSTVAQTPSKSKISIFRHYHPINDQLLLDVPDNVFGFYEKNNVEIWDYIDLKDEGNYYTSEVLEYFRRDGIKKYAMLDIWDKYWMEPNGLKDPRTWIQKLIHHYLHKTTFYQKNIIVGLIDKVLKQII